MNLKEIIDALLEHAKYDTPERYEVRVRIINQYDKYDWVKIEKVDFDEDGIYFVLDE